MHTFLRVNLVSLTLEPVATDDDGDGDDDDDDDDDGYLTKRKQGFIRARWRISRVA